MRSRSEHLCSWWRQGILLFDHDYGWSDDRSECLEAEGTGAWLGQSRSGGVTYVSSGGGMSGSSAAPLTVEVFDKRPRKRPTADTVGDFESSGYRPAGSSSRSLTEGVAAPPSTYRPATGEPAGAGSARPPRERLAQEQRLRSERPDRYLLQLWQSAARGVDIDRGRGTVAATRVSQPRTPAARD